MKFDENHMKWCNIFLQTFSLHFFYCRRQFLLLFEQYIVHHAIVCLSFHLKDSIALFNDICSFIIPFSVWCMFTLSLRWNQHKIHFQIEKFGWRNWGIGFEIRIVNSVYPYLNSVWTNGKGSSTIIHSEVGTIAQGEKNDEINLNLMASVAMNIVFHFPPVLSY